MLKQYSKIFFTALGIAMMCPHLVFAQGIAVGQWMDHLPYRSIVAVEEGRNVIYAATQDAVFFLSKEDNSLNRLTKVSGLSDVGISAIGYTEASDALVIAYTNSNIDIIQHTSIINLSDIKRKSILGDKSINSIHFSGSTAYLSTGFGIVVMDMAKLEIKDTYFITVAQDAVNAIAFYNDSIYAASSNGVYRAAITGQNLSDFGSWTLVTEIPAGNYNTIEVFVSKLYINRVNDHSDGIDNDSIHVYNGSFWTYFYPTVLRTTKDIRSNYGVLMITDPNWVSKYNSSYQLIGSHTNPNSANQALLDVDGSVWTADGYAGLMQDNVDWGVYPNGPNSNQVFDLSMEGGKLWVAPGGRTGSWGNTYIAAGMYSYIDFHWNHAEYQDLNSIHDIVVVEVDPNDNNRVFAGAWGQGVLELQNGNLVAVHNEVSTDSVLQGVKDQDGYLRVGGLDLDKSGNLWVSCTEVDNLLCVRTAAGSWFGFQFPSLGLNTRVGHVLVDANDQKWVLVPGNGILVFDDNGSFSNTNDDQFIRLVNTAGAGNLPTREVNCIAEDLDGEIWVGTHKGVTVFYSPELVFTGDDFDAQQILVEQDGYFQYLLEAEAVISIAIDGANRKWLGTDGAGVFLMSEDGTQELEHFTIDNSPLFSNSVTSIAINHENGEVFFGTEKGIVSYRGTATGAQEVFTDVYAYPNPVRQGYNGVIAIKGLVADADVKITDLTGSLIYQTTSLGGQAIWNGMNFRGDKAQTGVYLVFATNEDGATKMVTKILFIN
ncbi:MAG TPA: T9SS type A sorting domain-containing protein [Flavobacteriales bacterium]|nr:T9SS type A sorting domain-containing protein [Flavobacteriales bacterium]